MSARPDIITLCTVAFSVDTYSANLRSGFFFPFYNIDVFCTLRRLFVRFGLYSGFRLLCNRYRRAVHVHSLFFVWAGTPACCRSSNKNSLSVEICEGYNYENRNKVCRSLIPSPLRASKMSLLVITILNFV